MTPYAVYDEIADWYEDEFLRRPPAPGHPLSLAGHLDDLLGPGEGVCLEIGCGTGIHAAHLARLGWTPVGVDVSHGMLRHARARVPVAQADATRLPLRDGSVAAAVAVMVHTDMPDYPAVLREAARVLRPGGVFVHVGIHPCFHGPFADREDPDAVVLRPGYLDGGWTKASGEGPGVRARAGAAHRPLPGLLHGFLDARLDFGRFAESGAPTPVILAARAVKRRAGHAATPGVAEGDRTG